MTGGDDTPESPRRPPHRDEAAMTSSETNSDEPTRGEPASETPSDDREEQFFARGDAWDGAPIPDDFVDPEFADLSAPPGLLQPILVLLVLGLVGFLAWQYRGELAYSVSSGEPIVVGDVSSATADGGAFSQTRLPENRYVTLEGLGVQRVVAGDREYRRLLGSHVYVQRASDGTEADDVTFGQDAQARGARQLIEASGRLVPAKLVPRQLRAVFDYYSRHYGVRFCGIPTPAEILRYKQSEREAAALAFRQEHGREPTPDELEGIAGPECVDGYLFQADRSPADFRVYLILYAGFAIVVIVSIVMLARWARRVRQDA